MDSKIQYFQGAQFSSQRLEKKPTFSGERRDE
jgi:hypothetical protein